MIYDFMTLRLAASAFGHQRGSTPTWTANLHSIAMAFFVLPVSMEEFTDSEGLGKIAK
jgi:hypothetical protein